MVALFTAPETSISENVDALGKIDMQYTRKVDELNDIGRFHEENSNTD